MMKLLFLRVLFCPVEVQSPYPWDITEKLALTKGVTPSQASLIRALQREAPSHSWPLEFWFDVGVLDGDQDKFLEELKVESAWEDYFQKLYDTDGLSMDDRA